MSFILDALRKLEEKRAPETTRELLASGVPAPRGQGRGKRLWPYILTAALAAALLSAAVWFALIERDGTQVGEEPPPPLSSGKSGKRMVTVPPGSPAPVRSPGESGRISARPAPPRPDTPGPSLEIPPPEGKRPAEGEDPESTTPPEEGGGAPFAPPDVDGPVKPDESASRGVDEPAPVGESAAKTPVLPLHELPEEIRASLKDLRIEGHVYSDDPGFRLLSIDGSLKREGDTVRPGLLIETISPDGAVFTYRGYRFSMKGY